MTTNNESGRMVAIIIGVYLVCKELINMFIGLLGGGFGITGLITAAILAVVLFLGIKYTNYVVAVILAIVVLTNLGNNISNIGDNLLYLIEGIIDIICAVIICIMPNVKEHFTNAPWESK
ncbi:MAG: hypothetical protein IJN85_04245 [Oscillospiraceae bacterium]|nr:hypothetical protein [Oscillospiraceae bacterium]